MGRSFSSVGCHSYRCLGASTGGTATAGTATGASSTGTADATGLRGGFFKSALTSAANAGSVFIFLAYSAEERFSISKSVSAIFSLLQTMKLHQQTPDPRTQSGMAASQD